jgi:hypothetical protein
MKPTEGNLLKADKMLRQMKAQLPGHKLAVDLHGDDIQITVYEIRYLDIVAIHQARAVTLADAWLDLLHKIAGTEKPPF